MKVNTVVVQIFSLYLVLLAGGCAPALVEFSPATDSYFTPPSEYTPYSPAEIDILPLTEFVSIGEAEERSKIKVYVSLLDSFDCQMKALGVFRFELYEYAQRSAEPKGRRIVIWPDIDLTNAVENNNYWRDFLRAYEFDLDFEPQNHQNYVLQVTFLCPSGRRLSAESALKHTN